MIDQTILVKDITNLTEARYCAGMMVSFISFDFNPASSKYLEPKIFNEISAWLSGQAVLGSHDTITQYELNTLIVEANLAGFIFDTQQLDLIGKVKMNVQILEIDIDNEHLNEILERTDVDYFLVTGDAKPGQINSLPYPIIVGYDFNNPAKFDFNSNIGFAFIGKDESRPGYAESDELIEVLDQIEMHSSHN